MRKHGTQSVTFLIRFISGHEERFLLLLIYFGAQLKKRLNKACLSIAHRVKWKSRGFTSRYGSLIDRHTYLDFIWSVDEHVVLELLSIFDGCLLLLSCSDADFPWRENFVEKIFGSNISTITRLELSLVSLHRSEKRCVINGENGKVLSAFVCATTGEKRKIFSFTFHVKFPEWMWKSDAILWLMRLRFVNASCGVRHANWFYRLSAINTVI